jgi:hypothetical protein
VPDAVDDGERRLLLGRGFVETARHRGVGDVVLRPADDEERLVEVAHLLQVVDLPERRARLQRQEQLQVPRREVIGPLLGGGGGVLQNDARRPALLPDARGHEGAHRVAVHDGRPGVRPGKAVDHVVEDDQRVAAQRLDARLAGALAVAAVVHQNEVDRKIGHRLDVVFGVDQEEPVAAEVEDGSLRLRLVEVPGIEVHAAGPFDEQLVERDPCLLKIRRRHRRLVLKQFVLADFDVGAGRQ